MKPLIHLMLALSLCGVLTASADVAPTQWPSVGGNPGGQRYSPLDQISKENVGKLAPTWTYRHGDFSAGNRQHGPTAFEVTPLLIEDTLFFCTPYNRVIALDPQSGREKWRFDPRVKLDAVYSPVCRGVAYWRDPQAAPEAACRDRIYTGTVDARLIAIDARSGRRCAGFGKDGEVDLRFGLGDVRPGEYSVTSAPLVVNDVVVTGAFVKDGQRLNAPGGALRAFDARTGELRWVWDPVPPGMPAVSAAQVKQGATLTPGTPNVWSLMSADPEHGLIYVPTGNPSPDHFGGGAARDRKSYYGSSVVALDAASGAVRWHFQTVHHDLWDYDVAAQPVLFQQRRDGRDIPGVIGATKLGFIFLLNRLDGSPLFPVEERPVPKSPVPGEQSAPTQPFPTRPAPLHPLHLSRDELWGLTPWDKHKCQARFDELDYRGVFTPPSFQRDTLQFPGLGGGINWGSVSVDPVRNRMIVNLQSAPFLIRIEPRPTARSDTGANDLVGLNPQEGTPYIAVRNVFISPLKTPCIRPPWGRLVAIDLNSGEKLWERALGNLNTLAPLVGDWLEWGTPNSGGSLQTGAGLVFIAATMDKYFRAFDADTGAELWRYELPYTGNATPMTYRAKNGKQYVVIAAGGHGALGTRTGDMLMAFALPD